MNQALGAEETQPASLLGGRVVHVQTRTGFRSGIEPVLLAASIPAQARDSVVEGGTGAGAGLLCLLARVPGATGAGIERDPHVAALAKSNVAANGWAERATIHAGDLLEGIAPGPFDHAFANPPYHDAAGTPSPDAMRRAAKIAAPDALAAWAASLARRLRPRGTLSLILPAARLPAALAAVREAGCGSESILPLWPRAGVPAKLVIIRAIRQGRGPTQLLPGLVLHEADGRFTAAAQAVLRDGAALG